MKNEMGASPEASEHSSEGAVMTKLTPEIVEAAATAMGNGFIDEDGSRSISLRDVNAIWALINAAREQLGQQAAAPGVEQDWREAMSNLIALARPHFSDPSQMLALKLAEAALAVAPPPVGLEDDGSPTRDVTPASEDTTCKGNRK